MKIGIWIALLFALPAMAVESFSIQQRKVWLVKSPVAFDTNTGNYKLFVFLGGDLYADDLALPAVIEKLDVPAVAVMLGSSTDKPADVANRAKFADYVANEIMPALRAKLGRLPDAKRVIIGGWSFGGVTSSYIAFRHPELFGNVISQSGAFWRGPEGASEPKEWLTQQFRDKPKLPIDFYIEVGAAETHTAPNGVIFIEANRHLRDALVAKRYSVKYVEAPGAFHEPTHWRGALPDAVKYFAGR